MLVTSISAFPTMFSKALYSKLGTVWYRDKVSLARSTNNFIDLNLLSVSEEVQYASFIPLNFLVRPHFLSDAHGNLLMDSCAGRCDCDVTL